MQNLVDKMLAAVAKAQSNTLYAEDVFSQDIPAGKNQFLMFIKPEIMLKSADLKTADMLKLVLEKIEQFGLKIHNVKALGAKYLDEHDIIAQHYGVINKIASDAKANLSQGGKEKFKELYGKDVSEVKLLGGLEFLKAYPEFTPYTADILWQARQSKKLAGGTYAEDIKMDDETVYVLNGFHARQLHHFTQDNRCIMVLTVSGDTSWEKARQDFIGDTFPEKAVSGSIRAEFLAKKDNFGLPEVSIANNGVHLSAGPVEGLIELMRYNSDFSKGQKKTYKDYAFGQELAKHFDESTVQKIIANQNVNVDGKQVSVFDLTEQQDADTAISSLKKYFA